MADTLNIGGESYPLDSAQNCRAAWRALHEQTGMDPDRHRRMMAQIMAAGRRYGVEFSDDDMMMARFSGPDRDELRRALSSAAINDLPDSAFAYIEPGGKKDASGKTGPRSLRHFPIHDAAHVRNALSRAPQSPFGPKAMPKIRAAARKFGIEVSARSDAGGEFRRVLPDVQTRAFDFELRSTGGDGRSLEGHVVVFGATARIADRGGDFEEEIHRGAFDRSLARSMPVMQFDHGRDPRTGTVPIGVYETFEPDQRGYFVRGRLFDNPVVEPVRQAIAGKAIRGMSWRMQVAQDGQRWTRRSGQVDKRDVIDADVPEAGPVVFPAYDATTVSVRNLLAAFSAEERAALVRELADEVRLATDLTGRPDARSAGGGDHGVARPREGGTSVLTGRERQLLLARPAITLPKEN